jgi:hypothetical protein
LLLQVVELAAVVVQVQMAVEVLVDLEQQLVLLLHRELL